jgi:hypothetical protein
MNDRLHAALEALAERGTRDAHSALDDVDARLRRRSPFGRWLARGWLVGGRAVPSRRRWLAPAVTLTVSAAIIVGLVAVAVPGVEPDDDDPIVEADGSAPPPAYAILDPSVLPEGLSLLGAGEYPVDGPRPVTALTVYAREGTSVPELGVITYLDEEVVGLAVAEDAAPKTAATVRELVASDTDTVPGMLVVSWDERPGLSVALVSPQLDEAALRTIAMASTVDGIDVTVPGWEAVLHPTFAPISFAAIGGGPRGGGGSDSVFADASGIVPLIVDARQAVRDDIEATRWLFGTRARAVEVRGRTGVVVEPGPGGPSMAKSLVVWPERDDLVIAVVANDESMTADDVLALADQVEIVGAERWDEYTVDVAGAPPRPVVTELARGSTPNGFWRLTESSTQGVTGRSLCLEQTPLIGGRRWDSGCGLLELLDPARIEWAATLGDPVMMYGALAPGVERIEVDGQPVELHQHPADPGFRAWVVTLADPQWPVELASFDTEGRVLATYSFDPSDGLDETTGTTAAVEVG